MASRTYVTGISASITVDDDGTVTIIPHLEDVSDDIRKGEAQRAFDDDDVPEYDEQETEDARRDAERVAAWLDAFPFAEPIVTRRHPL